VKTESLTMTFGGYGTPTRYVVCDRDDDFTLTPEQEAVLAGRYADPADLLVAWFAASGITIGRPVPVDRPRATG
jgi:hypothetical protein